MKPIEVQSAGISDTGKLRADNQDQFLGAELTRSLSIQSGSMEFDDGARLVGGSLGHLFVVADGMGGHRSGSEASKFVVQYCANSILNSTRGLLQIEPSKEDSFGEDLKCMLTNAHRAIEERSKTNNDFEGMGTTLTLAYVAWPRIFIVHAGDTRCYLLRNGELKLVTRDHTVANEMILRGHLAPEELERSQWSNVLVNALGAGAASVFPDLHKFDLQSGDSILLCSDGLNKHVSNFQIHKTLLDAVDPQSACEELVRLANQAGGSDNITVIAARFLAPQAPNNRMQLVLSLPSNQIVLQDLEISESELDTCDDKPEIGNKSYAETDAKDTIDFPEDGDRPTDSH